LYARPSICLSGTLSAIEFEVAHTKKMHISCQPDYIGQEWHVEEPQIQARKRPSMLWRGQIQRNARESKTAWHKEPTASTTAIYEEHRSLKELIMIF